MYRTSYLTTRRWARSTDTAAPHPMYAICTRRPLAQPRRNVLWRECNTKWKKQDQVGTWCCTPPELSGFRGFQQGLANPKMPMVLASAEPVCRSPSRSGLGRSSGRTKLAPSDAAPDAAYLTSCPMQYSFFPRSNRNLLPNSLLLIPTQNRSLSEPLWIDNRGRAGARVPIHSPCLLMIRSSSPAWALPPSP